ncbi:hypothetical protein B6S44_24980 [Bosea sp. Tri-44]|uniref:hypothetical protein n=1 Tax=Bosea sp. Tri-44 TaxID=1972137 RepID=UPI00100D9D4E|nr:hypothetical protein [Bosea sp. Tri-44]RXT46099.1 hypothetical protein B6S44_24980 [Bosea sp. Tri-44]
MTPIVTAVYGPQTAPALPLSGLTVSELDALYDALLAAEDAIASKTNSPRIQGTVLHEYLSARFEGIATEIDMVVAELRRRRPSDRWASHERAHRLIMHACRCGESPADIADLARDLSRPEKH